MLIESHRHTAADLRLWRELEAADSVRARSLAHRKSIERARQAIREFLATGRPYYVATSWGKDSVVLVDMWLAMAPEATVVRVVQLDNEPAETNFVRDAYLATRNVPGYREVAYSYRDATADWFDRHGRPVRWFQVLDELRRLYGTAAMGLRADESSGRKMRMRVFGCMAEHSVAPLGWMTATDVFAYLYAHRLPVHPNYAMLGGGRWNRERIRVAAIGNERGSGMGRREWEREYYSDVLRRMSISEKVKSP